jgi:hypothetical protein
MKTRFFRSFSSELSKIAADIVDSDIRKLLAERRGEEYLEGGELPDNEQHFYVPVMGGGAVKTAAMGTMTDTYNLRAKKKEDSDYQRLRDTSWRGAQGAAVGAGLTKLHKDMHGRQMMAKHYRKGALLGMGAAVADKAYRHRQGLKEDIRNRLPSRKTKEAGIVRPNATRAFRSPASALSAGQKTGGFESKTNKFPGKPARVVRLGK